MNAVTLPPDLERFAGEAVAAGRYRDAAEVVRARMALLRRMETGRTTPPGGGYPTAEEMVERLEARPAGSHGAPA